MRARLLPATIALGSLLLVSKSVGLALSYLPGNWLGSWTVAEVVMPVAVAASAVEPNHAETAAPGKPTPPPPAPLPGTTFKPTAANEPPQPPPMSDEERQLLLDLRSRRVEEEGRERVLTQREGVLNAVEQRLVARASELAALQARLELLEKSRVDRDDANWAGLVKVYETMKPRDAASIFNDMDMPVLLQIVDRMKEAKAAVIFGAMQPDRARLLTTELAAKRSRTTTMTDPAATPADGAHS